MPGPEERLLDNLLGRRRVADDPQGERKHDARVALVQGFQGPGVLRGHQGDQRGILKLRIADILSVRGDGLRRGNGAHPAHLSTTWFW